MGLIYAELELVSAEDIALARRGYIKKDEVKLKRTDSFKA